MPPKGSRRMVGGHDRPPIRGNRRPAMGIAPLLHRLDEVEQVAPEGDP